MEDRRHCIHFLMLYDKITINLVVTNTYLLSHLVNLGTAMSQKSGNNLAESSLYALTRLEARYQLGCSHLGLKWGRIHFLIHSHCWQDLFPCDHMTEGPMFCWLLLGDYSQRLL